MNQPKRLRIGIIQRDDIRNVRASSGTLYSMSQSLQKHVGEVVHLGPVDTLTSKMLLQCAKVVNKLSRVFLGRRISHIHHKTLAAHYGRVFTKRIERAHCDVLYAPFASVEASELKTAVPLIYHTDMTWALGVNYYSIYSDLFDFVKRAAETMEQRLLKNARFNIFPSDWAADSAMQDYGVPAEKVVVVPYGANLPQEVIPSRERALQRELGACVHLLWIGVDWVRKGGQTACDCLDALLLAGVDARLTVCGSVPLGKGRSHPKINVVPFLDKSDPEQRRRISELYMEANFFLLPTLGEAAAIVLCEAAAHGLPCLVRNTGGLASVITNGVNGFLLPVAASGKDFGATILPMLGDEESYAALVRGSRRTYEERLNWDAWGIAVQPFFHLAAQKDLS